MNEWHTDTVDFSCILTSSVAWLSQKVVYGSATDLHKLLILHAFAFRSRRDVFTF